MRQTTLWKNATFFELITTSGNSWSFGIFVPAGLSKHHSNLRWDFVLAEVFLFWFIVGFWAKCFGKLFENKPTRLSKLFFVSPELHFKDIIKYYQRYWKTVYFSFAVSMSSFVFCEGSSTGLSQLYFRCSVEFFEKSSRQRSFWYVFIFDVLQKHSNVVVRISFYASRDIVWGKKISYKEARSLELIFQLSVDNFWHGQQKTISFLQRIYRKRNFSKGRFFVFGKFDLRSANPQDFRRNFWQIW